MQIYEIEHKQPTKFKDILNLLESNDIKKQLVGAYYVMEQAYQESNNILDNGFVVCKDLIHNKNNVLLTNSFNKLYDMLIYNDKTCNYMAAWAIAWSGYNETDLIPKNLISKILYRLVKLWLKCDITTQLRRIFSWAIHSCCMLDLDIEPLKDIKTLIPAIESAFKISNNNFDMKAATSLGILLKLWNNEETTKRINTAFINSIHVSFEITPFLKSCGYEFDEIEREFIYNP